jgi:lipoprotein-anchoring transpeptidase ErfK/SrfK
MRRGATWAAAAVLTATATARAAGDAPPWVDGGGRFADGASARVLKQDTPISFAPNGSAPRRGSAAKDALLPVYATRVGPGCSGAWLMVGPLAWMCEDGVEPASAAPIDARRHTIADAADGLPFAYHFVGQDGSLAYKRLVAADVGDPDMTLEPGFAVAIVGERVLDGARFGQTLHDLWVPMRDLGPVRPFAFRGAELAPDASSVDVGWVFVDRARVFTKPSAASPSSETRARFERVPVLEEQNGFYRIGDGLWMSSKEVRHFTMAPPPSEVDVGAGERWIDVELASQTLVAYEGARPLFATIVSTGKGKQGTPLATPKGVHRIWVKLLTSDMDNLEDENAARYYRIENVPWVQYFSKGVGLHGAFWHRSFGQVRSHGCVNLSPLDAQRLFWFTGPHLPAGWTAVTPEAHEPGAVVRVR